MAKASLNMFSSRFTVGKIFAAAAIGLLTSGAALAAEPPADRSGLSVDENVTINTACFRAQKNGDEAFNGCVREQLAELKDHPTPAPSGVSKTRFQAIERDCDYLRRVGIGQYNDCLSQALAAPAPESVAVDDPPPVDAGFSVVAPAAKVTRPAAKAPAAPVSGPTVVVLLQEPAAAAAKTPPAGAVSAPTYIMLPPRAGSTVTKTRPAAASPRPARAAAPAPAPPIIIKTSGHAAHLCASCQAGGHVASSGVRPSASPKPKRPSGR